MFHCLSSRFLTRLLLLTLTLTVINGCRLVITTDDKGQIVSASGLMDCSSPECAFDIEEATTETFTAVPAAGYRFVRWRGVCDREPTDVCTATVAPLPEELSQFDGDIELYAVFENTSKNRTWYRDRDGDNFGAANESLRSKTWPEGFVVNKRDCDDSDPAIFPWTKELDDGIDNNCNGKVDEGFVDVAFYLDEDGDGYGDPEVSVLESQRPDGYVRNKLDCNDSDAEVNPDASETLDGEDNDCDGDIDEGGETYYRDVDGDGYGSPNDPLQAMEPIPGYVTNGLDCDDGNSDVSPAEEERFDSIDNDCDGQVDEGFTERTYYADEDGDGYGDPENTLVALERPAGYVTNGTDNCVEVYNPSQQDIDEDGIGDACDDFTDSDQDGHQDSQDNCPSVYNPSQSNVDGDAWGDACDPRNDLDPDGDGINSDQDNCPNTYNPSQSDSDEDGIGDACDATDDSPGGGGGGGCPMSAEDQAMLDAVNAARAQARSCGSRGDFAATTPLTWSCALESAALTHNVDMASNGFFDHDGSDGSTPGTRATRAGYSWSAVGENIAAGGSYSAVAAVMQGWLGSDGHCANIMNSRYTNLGASKYSDSGSPYGVYWTQVFGRPR